MSLPTAHAGSRRNLVGENASPERERAHSPHLNARPDSPPTFLLHAEDDRSVVVENSLLLRAALRDKGVETETHLFPDGGHGFGLRLARGKSVEHWPLLFTAWAERKDLW
jgi:dipeptidyl aminopeptidase/acylaminoacyl peptidase